MHTCHIFCAGGFSALVEPIGSGDLIIAADGGLRHLQAIGLTPHRVLGDFDSLGYTPEGSAVFPVEKDDTDSMLALRQGLKEGYSRFMLYGALEGPRLDHTVANLQALQFLADRNAAGYLIGQDICVTAVKEQQALFAPDPTGILSLFCLGPEARGITLEGLQYPLRDGTLTPGFPLGVSNHFLGTPARITVECGSLLMIYGRENHGLLTRQPL